MLTNATNPTNPTNIFNFVPHDVTQWKISPFLDPNDRAAFNAVLEPTERVYRPFPTDFAIKHSLKTFIRAQRNHMVLLRQIVIDSNIILGDQKLLNKAMRIIKNYVAFIGSIQAKLIYEYKEGAKPSALRDLSQIVDEEFPYESYMTQTLRDQIYASGAEVSRTDFVRNVNP